MHEKQSQQQTLLGVPTAYIESTQGQRLVRGVWARGLRAAIRQRLAGGARVQQASYEEES